MSGCWRKTQELVWLRGCGEIRVVHREDPICPRGTRRQRCADGLVNEDGLNRLNSMLNGLQCNTGGLWLKLRKTSGRLLYGGGY
jgi:hypothetical protein